MIDDRLRDLVRLRMDQAKETLREARILATQQAPRGAINRAYYAMFYAVLAVLATRELGSSKHSGAISLFDREFVKAGDFPKGLSRSLHLAFEHRQRADYGELTQVEESAATQAIREAEAFVRTVGAYLAAAGLFAPDEASEGA
mgnify:CR=1 FL=1